jgi:predicted  nucleic acid-binding Zn-ribbon protein
VPKRLSEREEMEDKLQEARDKKKKLQKQIELGERRVERERLMVVREKGKTEKAAERAHQKEDRDSAKALQISQKGKRKVSRPPTSINKSRKQVGNASGRECKGLKP